MHKIAKENKVFVELAGVLEGVSVLSAVVTGEPNAFGNQSESLRTTGVSGCYSKRVDALKAADKDALIEIVDDLQVRLGDMRSELQTVDRPESD